MHPFSFKKRSCSFDRVTVALMESPIWWFEFAKHLFCPTTMKSRYCWQSNFFGRSSRAGAADAERTNVRSHEASTKSGGPSYRAQQVRRSMIESIDEYLQPDRNSQAFSK